MAPFRNRPRKKQPSHSAVAVAKWVDGFKLIVNEERSYQAVEIIPSVEILLELIERLVEVLGGRGNESRWNPDLVLYGSELTRLLLGSANSVHQDCVKFSD